MDSDLARLFDAIVAGAGSRASENLREPVAELRQRLSNIERRLAILENIERDGHDADPLAASAEKICQSCDRRAVARGLCSAHYQQWRYRQKKASLREPMGSVVRDFPGGTARSILEQDPTGNQLPA